MVEAKEDVANGGDHVGGAALGADDEGGAGVVLLGDGEEGGGFGVFTKGEVFSVGDDADDLDGQAVPVLEVAADGAVGVEELAGEFLIDDGNGRGLGSVGEADVASGEEGRGGCAEISGGDVVGVGFKGLVGKTEIAGLLRENGGRGCVAGEGRGVGVACGFDAGDLGDSFEELTLEMIGGIAGVACLV